MLRRIVTSLSIAAAFTLPACELIYDFEKPQTRALGSDGGGHATGGNASNVAGAGNKNNTLIDASTTAGTTNETVANSVGATTSVDTTNTVPKGGTASIVGAGGGTLVTTLALGGGSTAGASALPVGGAATGGVATEIGTAGKTGVSTGGDGVAGRAGSATGAAGREGTIATGGAATGGVAAGGVATGGGTGSTCLNTTDSCGTGGNCVVCTGGKTCSMGQCKCPSQTTECNGTCYDTSSDKDHCGTGCLACGAGQACSGGECVCTKGVFECGGCLAWDFDWTGTSPAPWLVELAPLGLDSNGAKNALLSHTTYKSAGGSLAVPINIDQMTTYTAQVAVSPCKTPGTINLAGYQLTAQVFLAGRELTAWNDAFQIDTWGPSGAADNFVLLWGSGPIPTNEWFPIIATFSSSIAVNRIGLRLTPGSINWNGTMYVDDVVITPAL